jgi:ABC-type metal ion transport system substrate-binding protein
MTLNKLNCDTLSFGLYTKENYPKAMYKLPEETIKIDITDKNSFEEVENEANEIAEEKGLKVKFKGFPSNQTLKR